MFDDIAYLQAGTTRQRSAYALLVNHQILKRLHPFDPILVGTIPLNIETEASDLDIICYWTAKPHYISFVTNLFHVYPNFRLWENAVHNAVIVSFTLDNFKVEVFGQNVPTKEQLAYRHMVAEHDVLMKRGEAFRQQVLHLKRQGYRTEQAFCMLLGLTGDPYVELLRYHSLPSSTCKTS